MAEPIVSGGIRAQAVLASTSGLARDQIINTFHFAKTGAGGVGTADFDAIAIMLDAFYNGFTESFDTVSSRIGKSVSRNTDACFYKFYDLGTAPPRTPYVRPFTLGATAGGTDGSLPREVALCLSFKSTGAGNPRRKRGRVFIGPLIKSVCVDGPGFAPMPTNALQETLRVAAQALAEDSGAGGLPWSIFSKVNTAQHMSTVTAWWVDNEFDTQRRRGLRSTARVEGSV